MRKIVAIILCLIVLSLLYSYFTYPNFDQIERELSKNEDEANQNNWIETYDTDVHKSLKISSDFVSKVAKAKLYKYQFLPPKNFDRNTAQNLAKIVSDSSSYVWGETTVEYNRNLIFLDSNDNVIAITKIDSENEWVNNSPFRRAMKWGKLSEKGYREFHDVINRN